MTPTYLLKVIMGGVGGYLGSGLPDRLDPPINSHHRDIAHSWVVAIGGVKAGPGWLNEFERFCSERTAERQRLLATEFDAQVRNRHIIALWLWTLLPSFIRGMAIGYLSHLALDAATPRGLPLIAK